MLKRTLIVPIVTLLFAAAPTSAGLFSDVLTGFSERISRPVGGIVRGITGPTIEKARAEVGVVVDDVDAKVGARLEQAGDVAKDVLKTTLDRTDDMLAGRIDQAHGAATDLVQVAALNVQATLGVASGEIAKRIEQVDRVTEQRVTQVDSALEARLDQVGGIAIDVIREGDAAIKDRLDQADEIVGRRLGNVDTILSKQLLGVEALALRLLSVIGLIVVLAWAVVKAINAWNAEIKSGQRRHAFRNAALGFVARIGVGLVGGSLFVWLAHELPVGSVLRAQDLRGKHFTAYVESLERFDLTEARFHASQLTFLQQFPTPPQNIVRVMCFVSQSIGEHVDMCEVKASQLIDLKAADQLLQRVSLVRDLLSRPALLSTAEGRREATQRIRLLETIESTAYLRVLHTVVRYAGSADASELGKIVPELADGCNPRADGDPDETDLGRAERQLARVVQSLACDSLDTALLELPSAEWLALIQTPHERIEEMETLRKRVADGETAEMTPSRTREDGAQRAFAKAVMQFRTLSAGPHADLVEARAKLPLAAPIRAKASNGSASGLTKVREAATELGRHWSNLLTTNLEPRFRAALLMLDDSALSLGWAAAVSEDGAARPYSERDETLRGRSAPPRLVLAEDAFATLPRSARQLANLIEGERFRAYEGLEALVVSERARDVQPAPPPVLVPVKRGLVPVPAAATTRPPARTDYELARYAAALEVKGLLPEAIERKWIDAATAQKAIETSRMSSLPLRHLVPGGRAAAERPSRGGERLDRR